MTTSYPPTALKLFLRQRKDFVEISDLEDYRRCRVQLFGRGIVLRDVAPGSSIKTKKQQVCRAGEFLVAEIDAKLGGFGIVPPDLDGAIVSSHYYLFEIDREKLHPDYLAYFVKTPDFLAQVNAQGSTNYAAIRPRDVLRYTIPMPDLLQQERVVAVIRGLQEQVTNLIRLQTRINKELEGLFPSILDKAFRGEL
jgi:type I restriction enzyme S subunit